MNNLSICHKINEDFTDHLIDIVLPYLQEGIISIYKTSYDLAKKKGNEDKVIYIFQTCLVAVEKWAEDTVGKETERIKTKSMTADYLEKLFQTVIKTEIILMTLNPLAHAEGIDLSIYCSNIKLSTFIHRCYIECAKEAHNHCFLFYDNVSTLDYNRNQLTVKDLFRKAVQKAIRKTVPIKSVLEQFDQLLKPQEHTMPLITPAPHQLRPPTPPPVQNEVMEPKIEPVVQKHSETKGGKGSDASEISGKGINEIKKKEVKKILEMSDLMSVQQSDIPDATTEDPSTINPSISISHRKMKKSKKSPSGGDKILLSVTEHNFIEEYGNDPSASDKKTTTVKRQSLLM